MSNADSIAPDCRTDRASRLAETVAEGLHCMAQPLMLAQWHLETAAMVGTGTEQQDDKLANALVALEHVTARLDFLRDVIRPFRPQTAYRLQSLREALLSANEMQQEILKHEGILVNFSESLAEANLTLPQGFAGQILSCMFSLLRALAPLSVTFDLSESSQSILLFATLAYPTNPQKDVTAIHSYSVIRSFVEVLDGDFSITPDLSSIRMVIPKIA